MFTRRRKDSGPSPAIAALAVAASSADALPPPPPSAPVAGTGSEMDAADASASSNPLKRFSWKRIKAAAITLASREPRKETSSSRVDTGTLSPDTSARPAAPAIGSTAAPEPSTALSDSGVPVVLKTLRRTESDPSTSPAPSSTTPSGRPLSVSGSRWGTSREIEILAMLADAKDRDAKAFRHVVAPRDVYINELGENVVVFDAYLELPLRDMPLRRAAELTRQLLSALAAVHSLSICHLDVNPSNLMQDAKGNLILIDFGLARVCDGTPHPPGRGTRGYIAPELFPPKVCHSTSPDLYSAGIVIGQLLEPYLAHCNLRILGGSASYPFHVEEVWQAVREFVEMDALTNDDLFPPVLQLAADLLLRLLTSSTPSTPSPGHRYLRLSAAQALQHPWLAVLDSPNLAEASFRHLTPNEWRLRRAGEQLRERQRRRGVDFSRITVNDRKPNAVEKPKPAALKSLDIDGVADFIKSGLAKRIVVMAGAGISTSCGIADFRSPGTGLYDNLQKYSLPHPMDIFDLEYFEENPRPFFDLAKELYPGNFKPSRTHFFLKLLANKGLLHVLMSQNIDTLESVAGIPRELVVEAHGSFARATCLACFHEVDADAIKPHVFAGKVPMCAKCEVGVVKPNIIFFGEALPQAFHTAANDRVPQADLLLVLGTSLKVAPFNSLVDFVERDIPRVLINRERVGDYGNGTLGFDFEGKRQKIRRDVFLPGSCDDVVTELCELLGWKDDLIALETDFDLTSAFGKVSLGSDDEDEDASEEKGDDEEAAKQEESDEDTRSTE
ncbi:hypothetical protein H9P43_000557 [Blastocladiella emersonii ATCC 22665]|nr:hypothetical protein H9P43_000557 [Blastocladiella emersonii ATCC 22665]